MGNFLKIQKSRKISHVKDKHSRVSHVIQEELHVASSPIFSYKEVQQETQSDKRTGSRIVDGGPKDKPSGTQLGQLWTKGDNSNVTPGSGVSTG